MRHSPVSPVPVSSKKRYSNKIFALNLYILCKIFFVVYQGPAGYQNCFPSQPVGAMPPGGPQMIFGAGNNICMLYSTFLVEICLYLKIIGLNSVHQRRRWFHLEVINYLIRPIPIPPAACPCMPTVRCRPTVRRRLNSNSRRFGFEVRCKCRRINSSRICPLPASIERRCKWRLVRFLVLNRNNLNNYRNIECRPLSVMRMES